jgi:LTXXQ motif family protein
MEKRLEATHGAALAVQPALTKFYDGLSDEQKARFIVNRVTSLCMLREIIDFMGLFGAPEEIRTPDPQIRRLVPLG